MTDASPATDPASATLAGIRQRQALASDTSLGFGRMNERHEAMIKVTYEDTPRLLAAVEAVLERHARRDKPVLTRHICAAHGPFGDDEGYSAACSACFITEKYVCATCRHICPDDDQWPCAEYLAITAALAGKEAGDE